MLPGWVLTPAPHPVPSLSLRGPSLLIVAPRSPLSFCSNLHPAPLETVKTRIVRRAGGRGSVPPPDAPGTGGRAPYSEPQATDDPPPIPGRPPKSAVATPPARPPKNGYIAEEVAAPDPAASASVYEDIGVVAPVRAAAEPSHYVEMNAVDLAELRNMNLISDDEDDGGGDFDDRRASSESPESSGPDEPEAARRLSKGSAAAPGERTSFISSPRDSAAVTFDAPPKEEMSMMQNIGHPSAFEVPSEAPPKSNNRFFSKREKKKAKRKEARTPPQDRRLTRHDNIPVREMSNMDLIVLMGRVKDGELSQDEAVKHRELYVQGLVDNPLPEKRKAPERALPPPPGGKDDEDDEINQLLGDIDNNVSQGSPAGQVIDELIERGRVSRRGVE